MPGTRSGWSKNPGIELAGGEDNSYFSGAGYAGINPATTILQCRLNLGRQLEYCIDSFPGREFQTEALSVAVSATDKHKEMETITWPVQTY